MKKLALIVTVVLVCLLVGCKGKVTGEVITETEKESEGVKSLANEEDLINPTEEVKPVKEETKGSLCDQLNKTQDEIYFDSYNLGLLKGKVQKKVYEVQYYKEKDEAKYNTLLNEIETLKKEIKEQTSKLESKVSGYKMLAEKCGIKVKLKKF